MDWDSRSTVMRIWPVGQFLLHLLGDVAGDDLGLDVVDPVGLHYDPRPWTACIAASPSKAEDFMHGAALAAIARELRTQCLK